MSSDHVWTPQRAVVGLGPLDREQIHLLLCLWLCGSSASVGSRVLMGGVRAEEIQRRPSFRNGI